MDETKDVTRLIELIRNGDEGAPGKLFEKVYPELRRIAAGVMRRERPGHTLQPTAVVHEAYMRMLGASDADAVNRAHFFAIAARSMRHVLVDHARRKLANKRGGANQQRVELDDDLAFTTKQSEEVLALHEALDRLQELDPRQVKVVEMHYFAGNTVEEIATLLGIGERTVKLDLQTARLFLKQQLDIQGLQLL